MDVELYVYDLSGGLARQYSQALIGQHIDAIYHTAIVLNNVEYFFGQGIHRKVPGSTHHGQPIKIVKLGRTDLPLDTIEEYVQSLESVYTPESYDLFLHNCNNFTQDLAMVLVGKSIPQEISSLPETFLRTPIGQMIRGQIDQSMRRMTQAPDAMSGTNATGRDGLRRPPASYATVNGTAKPTSNGTAAQPLNAAEFFNGKTASWTQPGQVWNIIDRAALDKLLKQAEKSCAVIFFTSATCPPCKICYGPYDELASEAGNKATLIKVDVSKAYEIGSRYGVRATPTFMTFLHGQKYEEWSGADPARLRGSVQMLIHMANPQHPHTQLNLPSFHGLIQRPTLYTKIPPLDKLAAKLGIFGRDSSIQELMNHIKTRTTSGEANAPMPDLRALSTYVSLTYNKVPITDRFALVDLIRVSAIDARVSSFLATETGLRTLSTLLTGIEWVSIPYQLRLVTCQLCCNLFSSPVFQDLVSAPSSTLRTYIDCLSDCLIAENPTARAAAAGVFYNLAAINHNERLQCRDDKFDISEDVEAALISGVFNEGESKECMHSELLTLGVMLYGVKDRKESTLWQLCEGMEIRQQLAEKSKQDIFKAEPLLKEVGVEMLGQGRT